MNIDLRYLLVGVLGFGIVACSDDEATENKAEVNEAEGDASKGDGHDGHDHQDGGGHGQEDAGGSSDHDPEDASSSSSEKITFWQDVAPIYFNNCVACHQADGIGPFALDNYDDAKKWAAVAVEATEQRTMPPWLVKDDGSCGNFAHSRSLSDQQIEIISDWVKAGAQEGKEDQSLDVPEVTTLKEATDFETPKFSPKPVGGALAQFDEYRCFRIDPKLKEDQFLTGYEVNPGNAALVHHVLAMPVNPEAASGIAGKTNGEVMQALADESPDRDGWPCFGVAGEGVDVDGIPVAWAPGQGVVDFPAETGYRFRAGDDLVIQVHYNMSNPDLLGQSDQSTLRLRLEDKVEREGFFDLPDGLLDTLFAGKPDALPPGEKELEYKWERGVDEWLGGLDSVELYGIFPHMHERGRKMKATIKGKDGDTCAADVPKWDFGWQLYYFYQEPIVLKAGDKLSVTCTYDTRGLEEPVTPGWGTQNEMCLAGVFVVP